MKDALVIIPALNEERSVGNVVESILSSCPMVDVIVISDGSTDQTAAVARGAGAKVVELPVNLGIGGAMQTGYLYAWRAGYHYAIQIDADGQHDPADLPKLLDEMERGDADMIVGSRYVERTAYRSSASRRVGMVMLATLIRMAVGYPIKDTTSGYRVVNRKTIELFSRFYPHDYPEVEVLVLLHRHRLRIREVAVEMKERQAGRSSITVMRSAYYMFKVSLAILLEVMRGKEARREGES
ncbi:glycosyltransferase family 2 protein [Ferroacidibacillus organovorans]|uniref:Glycosyl transferase family 2 n=1 Tax=Ferroacidibacillus organovorans TaxID=1765683 RepID=A0A101XRC7_9BACL|nr:glycosyltransferase family 2 protein [Ferroacidibacillus organovorans]KUO96101.1 glycosyl transferase family 2 [Ferroacidibacillus organovorans]